MHQLHVRPRFVVKHKPCPCPLKHGSAVVREKKDHNYMNLSIPTYKTPAAPFIIATVSGVISPSAWHTSIIAFVKDGFAVPAAYRFT